MNLLFGNFKVHIQEVPGMLTNRIYLTSHDKDMVTFIKNDGTAQTVKVGESLKEDELFFAEMSPDQLQAFAEALAKKGIKTHSDSVAEGKLTATERHLDDMRKIALHKFTKSHAKKDSL